MTSPTSPALSADALRFVRCEKSLERALAQRARTLARLPIKERHAVELANPAIAEMARETVAAWAFRVAELGGTVEAKVEVKPAPAPKRDAADACRVRTMRAFYASAKRAGLDTNNVWGMKIALSKYLGRPVPSRRDLSIGQWAEAIAGVEFGLVWW